MTPWRLTLPSPVAELMMHPGAKVERILVVGGGTAGWMAATYLNRFLRSTGRTVTLIESPEIGTVGVGEATTPTLVRFVRSLRLDEDDFLRQCHGTYKLGIRFVDWVEAGQEYWHPFGLCGGLIDGLDLFHFWHKAVRSGRGEGPYSAYSLQAQLGAVDRAPRAPRGSSPVMETGTYAYHFDAAAFAAYLKQLALSEGVEHLFDEVSQVVLDSRGFIDRLETRAGRTLTADLYLDCTGFRGHLIEQALGDPWLDWSHHLLCDRAVVLPVPRDPSAPPYTRSTALTAGWLWQIPLSSRVSCGYVHSSAHLSADAATAELLARVAPVRGSRSAEPRQIQFRVGRRQQFWRNNCVAVGLASGFIEPLESTGILIIQRSLELLLDYFPDLLFSAPLLAAYNRRMAALYEDVRDFIVLHYILNRRPGQPFWRDAASVAVPDSLRARLEVYDENGTLEPAPAQVFLPTNYYFILAGAGRLPRRPLTRADVPDFARVCEILQQIQAQNREWVEELPAHRDLVDWLHQTPF